MGPTPSSFKKEVSENDKPFCPCPCPCLNPCPCPSRHLLAGGPGLGPPPLGLVLGGRRAGLQRGRRAQLGLRLLCGFHHDQLLSGKDKDKTNDKDKDKDKDKDYATSCQLFFGFLFVLVQLSAHVDRVSGSHVHDFFLQHLFLLYYIKLTPFQIFLLFPVCK